MLRAIRVTHAVAAWAFLVGLVVQVFAIGLTIFGGASPAMHITLGWILHLAPLLLLLLAALSRAGRSHTLWALALAIVVFLVPIFATMRENAVIAALHPVSAMAAFVLAAVVAWRSLAALRLPEARPDTRPETGATSAA